MSGHISEHLFWAPDPRDDLAFTMMATSYEDTMDAIRAYLKNCSESFSDIYDMRMEISDQFNTSGLSETDWDSLWFYYNYGSSYNY